MKKNVLTIISALICGMMLTNCGKNDQVFDQEFGNGNWEILNDGRLVLKASNVENVNKDVVTVIARMDAVIQTTDVSPYLIVASAEFINGGFELIFPSTVPDEYLPPVVTIDGRQDRAGSILIIHALDSAGNYLGFFRRHIHDEKNTYLGLMSFVYANNSFSNKGPGIGAILDLSYEKGWNIVYTYFLSSVNSTTITTQKPENKKNNLVWHFHTNTIH
jgi:hypothetical protein